MGPEQRHQGQTGCSWNWVCKGRRGHTRWKWLKAHFQLFSLSVCWLTKSPRTASLPAELCRTVSLSELWESPVGCGDTTVSDSPRPACEEEEEQVSYFWADKNHTVLAFTWMLRAGMWHETIDLREHGVYLCDILSDIVLFMRIDLRLRLPLSQDCHFLLFLLTRRV